MNENSTRYIEVIIPPLADAYLYSLPAELPHLPIGTKVEVPLGRRNAIGYIINTEPETDSPRSFTVRDIKQPLFPTPCFHESTLPFYRWIADYYCVPLGKVLETAIPDPVPAKTDKHWFAKTNEDPPKLKGIRQQEISTFIRERGEDGISHQLLMKYFPRSSQTLKSLVERNALRYEEREEPPTVSLDPPLPHGDEQIALSEKQQIALDRVSATLDQHQYHAHLLHGVTGSGKTEVYIDAALHALESGGGVMVLVPEIALTPQLVDRFRQRLNIPIAVLHSSLPKRKRWECWRSLLEQKCQVVLGARSTIFAPLHRPSLIIVDEEHDTSYKQGEGVRYNARDLALVRGSLENATVILGSATPSVETFYNASQKKLHYIRLKERPFKNEALEYEIINMNRIPRGDMPSTSISPRLYDEIQATLINGQQVFLLYNRRGFARYLQCTACGEAVFCPNCSVPLTYHQQGNRLLCHYCSYTMSPPRYCTVCENDPTEEKEPLLELRGSGTQKVLEELETLFPQAKIGRLDRDTADKLHNLEAILGEVRSGDLQILAGTQMIAKGHDLPGVTLVGIIDCDVGLHMPDFRAAERVFQLLTQAGGRAGRREIPGKVILQTRVPHHPSVVLTTQEDYREFAQRELTLRKKLRYPPFMRLARIIASSTEQEVPLQYLRSLRKIIDEWCETHQQPIECLGPTIAPIEKVKSALPIAHHPPNPTLKKRSATH
jgi:primosomal protein N' (replication factor Y)